MILVLSTVMLITIDESQGSVFAQNSNSTMNSAPIMPASETSGNDDYDDDDDDEETNPPNSDEDGNGGDDDPQGSS